MFGSLARDEAGPGSDVDIAVRLDDELFQGGAEYFWPLEQFQERVSCLLGCKVDVVTEPVRKERRQVAIDEDRAIVFKQSSAPPSGHCRQRTIDLPIHRWHELGGS